MQHDPEVIQQIVSEVVLQLLLDGDIRVSPLKVDAVEREVAIVMRRALLREDALGRIAGFARGLRHQGFDEKGFDEKVRRYARFLRGPPSSGRGILSVVEEMVAALRKSPSVEGVCADDDALLRKILGVIARPARARKTPSTPPGGAGSPPAGGCPAEARVWDLPPRPRPPLEDLDRRERQVCVADQSRVVQAAEGPAR